MKHGTMVKTRIVSPMLQNGARMDEQDLVMKGLLEKRIGIQKGTAACAERDTVSISSGYERYIILH